MSVAGGSNKGSTKGGKGPIGAPMTDGGIGGKGPKGPNIYTLIF